MIRVLIVDDSAVLRQSIRFVLESDAGIQVVGEAGNGFEAVASVERLRPDVITMDLQMPKMDGLQAIDQIMASRALPIIVVTSVDQNRDALAAQALKRGAVSVVRRPAGICSPDFRAFALRLVEQVKIMSGVKVIHRSRIGTALEAKSPPVAGDGLVPLGTLAKKKEIVAIGSSTGGPAALYCVLRGLPANLNVPVLIVQHISFGFVEGLAGWLDSACPLNVHVSQQGERIEPGSVYIAPDNHHLTVDRCGKVWLDSQAPVGGFRPAVNMLFESVARYYGPAAAGVILTGMGADGATGIRAMRQTGAVTIAQDEASCVVFGMPKEAIALGAIQHVLPLDGIAEMIARLCVTVPSEQGPSHALIGQRN